MSSNRNRYTSAPLYGLKNKKQPAQQPQQTPPPQQPQRPQPPQQGYTHHAPQEQPNPYQPQGVPQQPYGQNPYGQNPYAQQPYPQGDPYTQNPYGQMQQDPYAQNAYGQAQPQQQMQQPRKRRYNWLIAVVTLVLPMLFLIALLLKMPLVHGVFIVCALSVITFMLIARPFSQNARYTLALIYAALAVVIAAALFFALPARDSRQASANTNQDMSALFGGSSALQAVEAQHNNMPADNPAAQPETQATDAPNDSMAAMRLNTFMNYWAESRLDSMLELCLPTWVNATENPKSELFILLANRTPISYAVEKLSGSDADTSRTVTLTVLIDKKNTSEPSYYQMQVLMLRINETWYVDPNSLGATKLSTTPQPGDSDVGTIPFVPTEAPTEAPTMSAMTLLYYNPDGGLYYHAKEDCYSVDKIYLPLKAFYYSDLNNTTFKNLLACHKCDAPARPVITGY